MLNKHNGTFSFIEGSNLVVLCISFMDVIVLKTISISIIIFL